MDSTSHQWTRKELMLIVGACALLVATVFGRGVAFPFVSWDDLLLVGNPIAQGFSFHNLKAAFTTFDPELYIPFTFLSYQLDWAMGSGSAVPFHLTNILLHTANSVLVILILEKIIHHKKLAVALGLLFAIHPLNTETVLWVSARKDVLSTFFCLGSLLCYMQSARKWMAVSIVLFAFALLSKVMVVTLPVVLLLLEKDRWNKKTMAKIAPFLLLSVVFGLVAIFGKEKALSVVTLPQIATVALKSMALYLAKFFVPTNLSIVYLSDAPFTVRLADLLFPLAVVLACVLAFLRKIQKEYALALLFFLFTLAPTFINISKGGQIFIASDRYAYIPMIGLLWFVGLAVVALKERFASLKKMAMPCAVVILGMFSVLSFRQASTWKTSTALYHQALAVTPEAILVRNNLGMEYLQAGKMEDAEREFQKILSVTDDAPMVNSNLGLLYSMQKRFPDAATQYKIAVEKDPTMPDPFYGMGNIAFTQGDLVNAAKFFEHAIALKPDYINAYNNLGAVYLQMGNWPAAIDVFTKAIEVKPFFPEAYYNLGVAYEQQGNRQSAIQAYRQALEQSPGNADAVAALKHLGA